MQMKIKRFFAVLLSVLMLVSVVPVANVFAADVVGSGNCGANGSDLTWTYYGDGTLVISGEGEMQGYGSYYYNGKNRTSAPWEIYYETIKTVVIENGVTSVGGYAFFNLDCIESATIPDSVETIGNYAFSSCDQLTSITIPDSVETIGNSAFSSCDSITSITIPDSVETIGGSAFNSCDNLAEVTLGNSVKTIGNYAFYYCINLKSITIPDSVETIDDYAFRGCNKLKSITIPDSVETIGDYAFSSCNNLTEVTLGNGVKTIGSYAFSSCNNLTEVALGNGVKTIGLSAFYGCGKIKKTTYTGTLDQWAEIEFSDSSSNPICYSRNLYINDALVENAVLSTATKIGNYAFYNCDIITSVTIPDSVETIGNSAFYSCDNLAKVTLGNGVETIGDSAFSSCRNLTEVTLGNSVKTIGNNAFSPYSGSSYYIESMIVPNSVTEIGTFPSNIRIDCYKGSYAESFAKTNGNPYVLIDGTDSESIVSGVYGRISWLLDKRTASLSVSCDGGMPDFATTEKLPYADYAPYINYMTLSDSVTRITKGLFNGLDRLKTVNIPSTVTEIPSYTFQKSSITSIIIPDSVTSIGEYAFSGCRNLTNIKIGNNVKSIDYWAFQSCSSLKSVTIPDSVTSLGSWAFEGCSNLETVKIGSGLIYINSYTFQSCYSLKHLTIGSNVKDIYNSAFSGCTFLKTVVLPESVTYVSSSAFSGATGNIKQFVVYNPNLDISNLDLYTTVIIYGYEGSLAQKYALETGRRFRLISEFVPDEDPEAGCFHSYIVTVTRPSCTTYGYTTHICSICGLGYVDSIVEAMGHTETVDEAVAPTCIETGLTQGSHCSVCSVILKEQKEIPASGHRWDDGSVIKEVTCLENGIRIYACYNCEQTRTQLIYSTGHNTVIDKAVAPTCTETGLTQGSHCSKCGEVFIAQEDIPALGHNEVIDEAVLPTCAEVGKTEGSHCSRCGMVIIAQEDVALLGHDYEEGETVANTCTENGYTLYTCKNCGGTKKENIVPAAGHVFGEVPVCASEKECTVCHEMVKVENPKAHDFVGVTTKDATCTESGLYTETCSVCGFVSTTTIDPLGHDFSEWKTTTEPTCIDDGTKERVCGRCSTKEEATIDALGHSIEIHGGKKATCTENGWKTYFTCKRCSHSTYEEIPAFGHNFTGEVKSNGNGTHSFECLNGCGEYGETASCSGGKATCIFKAVCSVCENEYGKTNADSHPAERTVFVFGKAATCTEEGFTTYKMCLDCGTEMGKAIIEIIDHRYTGGVVKGQNHTHSFKCVYGCGATGAKETCFDNDNNGKCDICENSVDHTHKYTSAITKEATCEQNGEMTYSCVCGNSYTEEIVAPGHDYEETTFDATCKDNGYTLHKCKRCGNSYKDNQTEVVDHNYNETTIPATCTESGIKILACVYCSENKVERTPELGHTDENNDGICDVCEKSVYQSGGHTHSYNVTVENSTCIKEGVATLVCTVCGETNKAVIEIDENAHRFGDWTYVLDETCIAKGEISHICTLCGKEETKTVNINISKHTGNIKIVNAVEVTCTDNGYTGDIYCADCNTLLEYGAVIESTGHNTVVDPAVAPTCCDFGLTRGSHCSYCGTIFEKQEFLDVIAHVVAIPATCSTLAVCKLCGKPFGVLEPDNHVTYNKNGEPVDTIETKIINPTCTTEGYEEKFCYACGVVISSYIVPAMGHDMVKRNTVASTCTDEGYTVYKCSRCGITENKDIVAALGHKDKNNDGKCDVCGAIISETPSFCEHNYDVLVYPLSPTCTEPGNTGGMKCSKCGAVRDVEAIPAFGHDFIKYTLVKPTCIEDGYTVCKCSRCGADEKRDIIPALGHNWIKRTVQPSCEAMGYTEYTCKNCGEIKFEDIKDALGHDVCVEPMEPATCLNEGRTEYRFCKRCGKIFLEPVVLPKTDHKIMVYPMVAPTCTMEGSTEGQQCEYCGEIFKFIDVIPATGHKDTNNDGLCDACGYRLAPTPSDAKKDCTCSCHKTGFSSFIWKIKNFFNKIFKKDQTCACGDKHW